MAGPKNSYVAAKQLSRAEMNILTEFGIETGEYAHRPEETQDEFIQRFLQDAPAIFIAGEGSAMLVAAVFDTTHDNVQTFIDGFDHIRKAQEKGLEIRATREQVGRSAAIAIREYTLERLKDESGRVAHGDDWPTDPESFHVELKALLPQALRDYGGSVIQMSMPLSVTVSEIEQVIASDTKLQRLQMICMTKDEAAAERNFAEKAATGPAAGAHKFLSNRQPDKYGDKQQIDIKNVGFQPPPSGPPPSVLTGKKDNDSD